MVIEIEVILLFQTLVLLVIASRGWRILKTLRAIEKLGEHLKDASQPLGPAATYRWNDNKQGG